MKWRQRGILRGEHRIGDGPVDTDLRIVPEYPAVRLRGVRCVNLVLYMRIRCEGAESVRESGRNEEYREVFRTEFEAPPLQERCGIFSQINHDIQNASAGYPHQFRLGMGRLLEMEAAEDAGGGAAGVIVLNERGGNTRLVEPLLRV